MQDPFTQIQADEGGQMDNLDALVPSAYDELRALASELLHRRNHSRVPLSTMSLLSEAYLRLAAERKKFFRSQEHFLAVAAIAMRRVIVDRIRRVCRQKRGRGQPSIVLEDEYVESPGVQLSDVLAVDEALDQLASIDRRAARVVELRYFGGYTLDEVAEILALSRETVKRDWRFAKTWLKTTIEDSSKE